MKSMAELVLMALLDKQVTNNIFTGESLLPVKLVIFHNVYFSYIFTHMCMCKSNFYVCVLVGCLKLCSLFVIIMLQKSVAVPLVAPEPGEDAVRGLQKW